MLKIENLVVNYGAIEALRGISLEVKPGGNRIVNRRKTARGKPRRCMRLPA